MSSFFDALNAALPALEKIRDGLGPFPTASHASVERLRSLRAVGAEAPPVPKAAVAAPASASVFAEPAVWTMETLREAALACTKCPHLVKTRTQVVFGVGNPNADLMFVGEAPGADEDAKGEPFVGKAGQLLTKIIGAMGFSRDEIYIGNVLKCRPDMPEGSTGNRKPRPEEMKTCLPWLEKQIGLIKPKVLVALGATAVEGLLGNTEPLGKLRGRFLDFQGIPVMATYHPAYLLRNQSITEKRKVWEDMLKVLERLNLPISEKQRNFFTKSDS
ncbi:uracil-DNA glycosylase [soil metagenome]